MTTDTHTFNTFYHHVKKKEALFMALKNKILSQDIILNLIYSTGKL